jgi:hypothetical protein
VITQQKANGAPKGKCGNMSKWGAIRQMGVPKGKQAPMTFCQTELNDCHKMRLELMGGAIMTYCQKFSYEAWGQEYETKLGKATMHTTSRQKWVDMLWQSQAMLM